MPVAEAGPPGLAGRISGQVSGFGRLVTRLSWPFRPALLDAAWAAFSVVNLIAIFVFENWETVPFHFIWISFTLLYGFRTWATRPTLAVLGVVMATTGAAIGLDVSRGTEPLAEVTEVPLMAAMFVAMVWHARRKLTAEQESRRVGEENARLLATQRRFLQDASHQLRTPITIALGHAELLAGDLTGGQEGHDIEVVLGELNQLRRIAERLLVIAAAEGPEFLQAEPVELDGFVMEILRRWRPTADRRWQLGRLDKVTVTGRPGTARPGRRRAAGERGAAHRQRGCDQALGDRRRSRAAGPADRRGHRPGHRGRAAATRLRPLPQRGRQCGRHGWQRGRQRAASRYRPRACAGPRGRPGPRRRRDGAQRTGSGQRVRAAAARPLRAAGDGLLASRGKPAGAEPAGGRLARKP